MEWPVELVFLEATFQKGNYTIILVKSHIARGSFQKLKQICNELSQKRKTNGKKC